MHPSRSAFAAKLLLASVLAESAGVGCGKKREETPRADLPPPPPAPDGVRLVLKSDCAAWADHGVRVLLSEWKDAARGCPPVESAALQTKLDGERSSLRDAAADFCSKSLDHRYAAEAGRCYLAANNVKALAACKLLPMTSPGDSDLVAEFARQRDACAARPRTGASGSAR